MRFANFTLHGFSMSAKSLVRLSGFGLVPISLVGSYQLLAIRAFLRTYDTHSVNAEPHVSFLYRLFRSGQKHLQAELDCLCLNRFRRGSEAFVIHLERRSEITWVLPKRIGQGCSAKDCHGTTHPCCVAALC
jgi:hypothetical protein